MFTSELVVVFYLLSIFRERILSVHFHCEMHSRRGDSVFSQVYFKKTLKSKKIFLKTLDYFLNP